MSDRKVSVSGCPIHAVSGGDLTYDDYLNVSELLKLQNPKSQPTHPDELLFIIIHQAYELWFKLILHEMENAIRAMGEQKVFSAHHCMNRIVQILRLLVQQIHIVETMSPVDFLQFRDQLMPASGFQSTQFRELEYMAGLKDDHFLTYFKNRPESLERLTRRLKAPDLRMAYYDLLTALGYGIPQNAAHLEEQGEKDGIQKLIQKILPIYQFPSEHPQIYLLSESLVEFDEVLGLWREHHIKAVERVIGSKRGTGGSTGVEYLRSTVTKQCFPCLWEVRTHLKKN